MHLCMIEILTAEGWDAINYWSSSSDKDKGKSGSHFGLRMAILTGNFIVYPSQTLKWTY